MTPDEYKQTDLPNSFLDGTVQICVVTHDLERAVRAYADRLGIGPWWIQDAEPPEMTETRIRGVETPFSMRLALAWTGDMMWEIIQPLSGPTVYKEFLEKHGEGGPARRVLLHARRLRRSGGELQGTRIRADPGVYLERRAREVLQHGWRGPHDLRDLRLARRQALPEPQSWYPARREPLPKAGRGQLTLPWISSRIMGEEHLLRLDITGMT